VGFDLGNSEGFANVVETGYSQGPRATDRARKTLAPFGPTAHTLQAATQRLIDQVLEASIATLAQPLEHGRDIVIKGQGCPHTLKHKAIDVLMSKGRLTPHDGPPSPQARAGPAGVKFPLDFKQAVFDRAGTSKFPQSRPGKV